MSDNVAAKSNSRKDLLKFILQELPGLPQEVLLGIHYEILKHKGISYMEVRAAWNRSKSSRENLIHRH